MAKSAGWTVNLAKNTTAPIAIAAARHCSKNAQVEKEFSVTVILPKDGIKKSIFQGQKVLIGLGKEVTAPSRSAAGFCACRVWRASLGRHNRIHDSTLWN